MTLKSKKDVDFNSTKDPYAQREAEKYENPIPSRELILQFIEHAGKPLRREELAEAFTLETEDQLEALRRRLRAMERDGQLLFNRGKKYCLVNNEDLIAGRIIGHADGFGFIKPDDGSDDLFLSPREMNPCCTTIGRWCVLPASIKKAAGKGRLLKFFREIRTMLSGVSIRKTVLPMWCRTIKI